MEGSANNEGWYITSKSSRITIINAPASQFPGFLAIPKATR
jgi:hypothetical protein